MTLFDIILFNIYILNYMYRNKILKYLKTQLFTVVINKTVKYRYTSMYKYNIIIEYICVLQKLYTKK